MLSSSPAGHGVARLAKGRVDFVFLPLKYAAKTKQAGRPTSVDVALGRIDHWAVFVSTVIGRVAEQKCARRVPAFDHAELADHDRAPAFRMLLSEQAGPCWSASSDVHLAQVVNAILHCLSTNYPNNQFRDRACNVHSSTNGKIKSRGGVRNFISEVGYARNASSLYLVVYLRASKAATSLGTWCSLARVHNARAGKSGAQHHIDVVVAHSLRASSCDVVIARYACCLAAAKRYASATHSIVRKSVAADRVKFFPTDRRHRYVGSRKP